MQVTASNLIGVDLITGQTIEGEGHVIVTAFSLHRAINQMNPTARCIMHTHQPYVASLNCLQDPRLLMVHQESCSFYGKIAYDSIYNGVSDNEEEGKRLAQVLQDKEILFQSNHGVTAAGSTVAYTFGQLYYLERACMYQMMAMKTGRQLKEIPTDIVMKTKENGDRYDWEIFFDAMKRMLLAKGSRFDC
ncbi:putative aldolase class 2 protein PA3430 [Amphiura filiformis]|uniref:putative aldolase class 2 protein PA3430 n=1 Tax=Amphiura filiformis TaxID=82378 RepID=UPI003B21D802